MIYIGADHRGFKLKEAIKKWFGEQNINFEDLGAKELDPNDDYPIIAKAVAEKVIANVENRGILICGSGAGVCIVANKIKGIRAAEAWNPEIAKAARNDDNANVLCLSAGALSLEEVKSIARIFLDTSFGGAERYKRRLQQIEDIESEK
ncbi:MAG: RpiB/LacA/LacB family sugar-phosphate isomerase [Candidatus Doudnabacteria bacterium]|nr:RpiB/LacA/LacB family sugar-phosphate isomerase [Candidatus Doudnabacteria bacterium]